LRDRNTIQQKSSKKTALRLFLISLLDPGPFPRGPLLTLPTLRVPLFPLLFVHDYDLVKNPISRVCHSASDPAKAASNSMLDASVNPAIAVAIPTVPTLEQITTTLFHLRASEYTILAGFVVYVWDFILTFPDELSYIWVRTRANLFTKFLFFLVGTFLSLTYCSHRSNWLKHVTESIWSCYWPLACPPRYAILHALSILDLTRGRVAINPIRKGPLTVNVSHSQHDKATSVDALTSGIPLQG
jgi:hypothetical protein